MPSPKAGSRSIGLLTTDRIAARGAFADIDWMRLGRSIISPMSEVAITNGRSSSLGSNAAEPTTSCCNIVSTYLIAGPRLWSRGVALYVAPLLTINSSLRAFRSFASEALTVGWLILSAFAARV